MIMNWRLDSGSISSAWGDIDMVVFQVLKYELSSHGVFAVVHAYFFSLSRTPPHSLSLIFSFAKLLSK